MTSYFGDVHRVYRDDASVPSVCLFFSDTNRMRIALQLLGGLSTPMALRV